MGGKKVFSTLLLAILAAVPVFALEPIPSCRPLDSWVPQIEVLPTDYDSLALLHPVQRRAVYRKLSNAERAALWHHQWALALEKDNWNDRQRALIVEAGRFLSAETFAVARSQKGTEAFAQIERTLKDFEKRVLAEFPRDRAFELFYALAPGAGRQGGAMSDVCDCGPEAGLACSEYCRNIICVQTPEDCGMWWVMGPCTGRCVY